MKSIIVSNTSETAIYIQLYEQISSQILSGELKSNSALPSIRTMAKELRVSIITIKKTWQELEKNGYIYTVAGKGSYVSENTPKALNDKKNDYIEAALSKSIKQLKTLNVSKAELIGIINKLYDND